MSKLKQNKEQKRDAILKAAQELFLSEGYVQASMDTIARRAEVTKQTVYRYFPSKEILFEEMLKSMRTESGFAFLEHLENPNTREALHGFALGFIKIHLSENHIATVRLLISESTQAPELIRTFVDGGPNKVETQLAAFFKARFKLEDPNHAVTMWISMLLGLRARVLVGHKPPSQKAIRGYAEKTTDFFLSAMTQD